jgi:pilus assembly protein CpaE
MSNPSGDNAAKPALLAFVKSEGDMATLRTFAEAHEWADADIRQGDIRTAAEFLKSHASLVLLVVEIPSAAEAPALLDALADVCDPDTKVVTIGDINEYSFYCWLMDLGIFSYLLKPLTEHMLETAYQKSVEPPVAAAPAGRQPGKIIAITGTRGGVGATTVALNLAGIFSGLNKKHIALVDADPQEGSIALALDIEPSRGLRDALEKPDRIDSLFMDRVMTKPIKNFSVLSAEENLQEHINTHEQAADVLLQELRDKFDVIVIDIPRHLTMFSRKCLRQADQVVMVAELTLFSLRDALRYSDMMRDALKMKPPLVVANRVGFAGKHEMLPGDFEKGINAKLVQSIAFLPELFMQVSPEIPAIRHKANPAIKPLYALAELLMPETKGKVEAVEKKSFSLFKKKDK